MTIPVPPSATKIRKIRVTGKNQAGSIEFVLIRASWNSVKLDIENEPLLEEKIANRQAFDREWVIGSGKQTLDPRNAALALVVSAVKDTEIFFVAAEFA